jgi:hypothetical protein
LVFLHRAAAAFLAAAVRSFLVIFAISAASGGRGLRERFSMSTLRAASRRITRWQRDTGIFLVLAAYSAVTYPLSGSFNLLVVGISMAVVGTVAIVEAVRRRSTQC